MVKEIQGDLDAMLQFVENPRNVGSSARKLLLTRLNKFRAAFSALAEGYEAVVSRPKEAKVMVKKIPSPAPAQPKRYAEVLKRKREASRRQKGGGFVYKQTGGLHQVFSGALGRTSRFPVRDNEKDLKIRQVKETSKGQVVVPK